MKSIFLHILSFSFLFIQLSLMDTKCGSKSTTKASLITQDSILLEKLRQVDKKKYIGLSVDSFMKDDVISQFKSYKFIDEPPSYLSYLLLRYSKTIHLEILVHDYKYVEPFSSKRKWNLSDYKKEKIAIISLYNGRQLVEEYGRQTKFAN